MRLAKIQPDLARMATRQNLELAFVCWSLLRQAAIETNFSSHYKREDFRYQLAVHGLNYTHRHMNNIIRQGTGIFWDAGKTKIFLRSMQRVSDYFKPFIQPCDTIAQRRDVFVAIRLSKSIENLRAEIYWAWFVQFEEKTISRATLTDLFGFSGDQQRNYEEILGQRLIVKHNYVHIDLKTYSENPQELPEHYFSFEFSRQLGMTDDHESVSKLAYQLPNTFLARLDASDSFPVSDASNRAKNATRDTFGQGTSSKPNKRIYWLKWDKFEKLGALDSFIRVAYQNKKRIWLAGNYL